MSQPGAVIITDKDGLRVTAEVDPPPSEAARIPYPSGRQVRVRLQDLALQEDGTYRLPMSLAELEQRDRDLNADDAQQIVVPIIAEELDVQKRRVATGGVRIHKTVREREEVVDEPLLVEKAEVRRVPINRVVDGPLPIRYEGSTMIVPLLEEVLVVEKRLVLREELHITQTQAQTHQPQTVTLRREEASIEPINPE